MRNRVNQRGFTLIELTLAITLVAAISVGMMLAMRTSLMTMEKVDNRMQFNRRSMSSNQILTRQIGAVMPTMTDCGNPAGQPTRIAAFRGYPDSLWLVSSYSMSEGARGAPRFLEFQVVPLSGGGFRLVENEHPYPGPSGTVPFCASFKYLPMQMTPDTFIVADHLASCRFSYREPSPPQFPSASWVPIWERNDLPAAVRIEMSPLDSSAALLPVMNVNVPIRITRQVGIIYDDRKQ